MISAPPSPLISPFTEHRVRFDEQCVLIPDPVTPSRMPRFLRKSYTLPLWKRKAQEPHYDVESEMFPKEDEQFASKASVPRFIARPWLSVQGLMRRQICLRVAVTDAS